MNWKSGIFLGFLTVLGFSLYKAQTPEAPADSIKEIPKSTTSEKETKTLPTPLAMDNKIAPPKENRKVIPPPSPPIVMTVQQKESGTAVFKYKMEDGVAVVFEDVVLGQPQANAPAYGRIPPIKTWEDGTIPIHIQPDVDHPDRVRQAMELFADTPIVFVPYENQNDALVFIDADGECKSYIGKMGGRQPIWIGPQCGPREIAHEIMHALGFIHEQNRNDRDGFIKVFPENIQEGYEQNFEILPDEFMKISGLTDFDFNSIMIYSKTMFAKPGTHTLESKKSDTEIIPGTGLSQFDRARLEKAYGEK
ncbi:MAG: M12 family metallopeptidase [Bdellovibrionales bacterium]|nr:M12 family metallopeptidase [Bdellovibrionales bacterium]